MLTSARKAMPPLDYVSIVRSVYTDRRALLFGACASAAVAGICAFKTQSLALALVAIAFLIVGAIRFTNMRAFWQAGVANEDADAAEHWENRALFGGTLVAVTHGIWCLIAILVVRDPFVELASCTLSIAATVGMVARNFGLDRLITIQTISLSVPLWIAMVLRGGIYHPLLSAFLVIMLISFRKLAGDIRTILLAAVHGRLEATRLAAELDVALATMNHGVLMLDETDAITVVNERASHIFARLGIGTAPGQSFAALLHSLRDTAMLPTTAIDRLGDTVEHNGSGKVLLSLPGGHYYEVTISSRRDHTVLLFEDISERVKSEEQINFMARHDGLTSLPNRAYFGELVMEDLGGQAESERLVSLMIVDVDDFKHVNDTLGHIVGDRLLGDISERLRGAVATGAVLARLGGDEFVVYHGAVGTADAARTQADRILAAFSAPFAINGIDLAINVSVGLVTSTGRTDDLDALMTKADLALYTAKGDGKGKRQMFHAQMDIDYHYRQRLKADLQEAVRTGALSLAFQPLLDIRTRKVMTCEALARWEHPEFGMIPPSVFIPLAEEIGLISDITAWVMQRAMNECSQWPGTVSVAVNVSARDFRGDLTALVDQSLQRSGLSPSRLEIEVTETAVIEEHSSALTVLENFAAQGIAIALDDFGTGYSSLSYLSALPFTKLKIDRSFVEHIATDTRAMLLLASVARLGRDLKLTVVAEGVETEDQLNALLTHTEIEQVQGYLFSRPLPSRDIIELISRFNAAVPVEQTTRKLG